MEKSTTSHTMPLSDARLSLTAEVYAALMAYLQTAEAQARGMHTPKGDECSATIDRAIGEAVKFDIESQARNRRRGDCPVDLHAMEREDDPTDRGQPVEANADPRPLAQIIDIALARRKLGLRACRALERPKA